MNPVKIAIFASGRGSNAVALIQKAQSLKDRVQIGFVLSDQPGAGVLERSQALGVRTLAIPKSADRIQHEKEILQVLQDHQIDWIFLAGYMRLLSADFLKNFARWTGDSSQIVNIHPSLLPQYPGVNSIARAYNDGASETGVTIHLVDAGMDTGKILLQEKVNLKPGISLAQLEEEIHQLEHKLYTQFLQEVADGEHPTKKFELA